MWIVLLTQTGRKRQTCVSGAVVVGETGGFPLHLATVNPPLSWYTRGDLWTASLYILWLVCLRCVVVGAAGGWCRLKRRISSSYFMCTCVSVYECACACRTCTPTHANAVLHGHVLAPPAVWSRKWRHYFPQHAQCASWYKSHFPPCLSWAKSANEEISEPGEKILPPLSGPALLKVELLFCQEFHVSLWPELQRRKKMDQGKKQTKWPLLLS